VAAHTSFPPPGAQPQVRGDPATMVIRIREDGVDQDITTWTWRCYVRDHIDGAFINECEDFTVTTPNALAELFPDTPSTTPCVLLAKWTPEQTQLWQQGFVADIEQLTPEKRTPLIFDSLRIDRDVSNEIDSP
jgi:hypothetical protein